MTEKVFACVDGSRSSESVCDHAAWACQRLNAPMTLLHVIRNPHGERDPDYSGSLSLGNREELLRELVELEERRGKLVREQGKAVLADAIARVQTAGVENPGKLLRNGDITEALAALEADMRLLVLGKQGKDGAMVSRHIGSHLESIIRTLHAPMLVVPLQFRAPDRFLIAYDGSDTADKVVERLGRSSLLDRTEAHILMVGAETDANREKLAGPRARLERQGFQVTTAVKSGDVNEVVCDYREAHDIHLLAMGAYGHSRLRQFFVGSTTSHMIMRSPIPLLILR
ncbi:universal stress protein [Methylonatrum kenyense]|uniref:universal stress protein n=1 Tax=Methylonatrum kenyense TaxID=455253 RepID=UPI0020BFA884|nr:universal stress protein [Methylonatrum kenyense]MCK8516337.1 universal stress protein [Methylonatrum kenyense]